MTDLLPCVEIDSNDSTHSIIWLHGLGADGHDFEPIVDELTLKLPVRFVFPHAPSMPVTVNNGLTMPAWYDIKAAQIDNLQDETGIKKSQQLILALIEREIDRGVKSSNIILAGFSQGGAIALHTGLRYDKPLAGIMGLSTYLPLVESVKKEIHDANRNTPILLAHGAHDPIIPFELAEKTNICLNQLGYASELHPYVMEHSVCPEEIDMISDWINERFT
ncbi:MAG: alpha/beta hydrolase [Gammaproteobacteria bacterium]|nr:alpha/beta hydrolase [Gammaproteobacteria bacterium]